MSIKRLTKSDDKCDLLVLTTLQFDTTASHNGALL